MAALEPGVMKLMAKHTAALLEGLVGLFGDWHTLNQGERYGRYTRGGNANFIGGRLGQVLSDIPDGQV